MIDADGSALVIAHGQRAPASSAGHLAVETTGRGIAFPDLLYPGI